MNRDNEFSQEGVMNQDTTVVLSKATADKGLAEVRAKLKSKGASSPTWNQYNEADPLVGPGTNVTPGPMTMGAKMKLHTKLAINLFRGRKAEPKKGRRPIIGLARFARQVALVWTAASNDDPYADQCLLKIESAFTQADELVESNVQALQRLLEGMEDFEVELQSSNAPVEFDLKFYSPWGFRGALLLRKLDKLIRLALTARHLGLFIEDDWSRVVYESMRAVRHMFAEVNSWVSTGVRRKDVREGNALSKRALAVYTEQKHGYLILEEEVVIGRKRAKLSPISQQLEEYLAAEAHKAAGAEEVETVRDETVKSKAAGKSVKKSSGAAPEATAKK